ncbi:hypothetical protein [Agrobacterium tumefaciens]|uniref:hypothetical protein n=1 Tax=Agrobacterium tumefaciens TaxID=358 RepID=UPI001572F25A|nr:hypothetical protein [Agrobacterium tumefaciens]NTE33395.1 hypothetical protein [Agrobacterium tumefaciens]NTE48905.1 hypothetical protein [Agrobacterium tumefaciens]
MSGEGTGTPKTPEDHGSTWLGRYIAKVSVFWKAAICFQIAFLVLMVLHAGALLAGWHDVSNRILGYSSLVFVGFFVSLLCHAYVSISGSMKRNKVKKQQLGSRETVW